MYRCLDVWMCRVTGVIYVRYVYVYRYCDTADIKLADRFSRAVNFSFHDKVTRLAGWQVVFFFRIRIKINMHAGVHTLCILRYHRYHSLLCIVDSSFPSFFIL